MCESNHVYDDDYYKSYKSSVNAGQILLLDFYIDWDIMLPLI